MTADYTQVGQEGPREICANLAMTLRDEAACALEAFTEAATAPEAKMYATFRNRFEAWASRLERAVRRMDEEKASRA